MSAKRFVSFAVPAILVTALVAGCTGGGGGSPKATGSATATNGGATGGGSAAYEKVVANVLKSVVQINTSSGLGSGVVYDDKGDIVTNAHVVGDATSFEVTTATSKTPLAAKLVASYPPNDIAVIKLSDSSNVTPATFGDSGDLRVGQEVLAMGSPLGLSGSVTNGIVSAVGRTVQEPRTETAPATTITDMVQTSAAINPGNSGGALVDLNSKVVGVPTLAATNQEQGGAAPGIGFALSSNMVKRIADQIIKDGKVTNSGRAALGVTVRPAVDENYQPAGALVVSVTANGPAAKAGIRAGDVITNVGGTQVTDVTDLTTALAAHKPGDTVEVTVDRNGSSQKVQVTLGEQ
ncbi:S1C family serine protease [Actinocatenispora rupis]|uniref:Protease n=1 Tax=Actinocatenispora rupis TaxID=519421 RepID=A0A8J3NE57_9ACTN|nr:trypsin-like peptidase domain-containing protein [Actinocatenispora rupis]GID13610.1 protease [Actinocatenispora rupis]